MALNLVDLDELTRAEMAAEVAGDVATGKLYLSPACRKSVAVNIRTCSKTPWLATMRHGSQHNSAVGAA